MATGDTCTPLYGLPYATGSSRPCDIDQTLCDFSVATQAQLDRVSGIVNRTATTIPMAKVAMTIPQPFVASSPTVNFVFDTVLVDTDNMFDSSFPDQVTINTPGIYGAYSLIYLTSVTSTGPNQSGTTMRVDVSGFFGNFILDNLIFPSGTPVFQAASGTFGITSPGTAIVMNYSPFVQSTDTVTVQRAEMGLFWLGDLS